MQKRNEVYFVGYASGIAGSDAGSGDSPLVLKKSPFMAKIDRQGLRCYWQNVIQSSPSDKPKIDRVAEQCTTLANTIKNLVNQDSFFVVFGGDHSCAIGTWSGVYDALDNKGELGLIWIDAHMDSHTPETTLTGNIHGMPLATLLGYGHAKLTHVMNANPTLKPENICLIGIRSYEEEEAALLKKLNIRIFFMDEVKERGMPSVMKEALSIVKKNTTCFGVTLDIDAIDPMDAPGTGIVESDGISGKDISIALQMLANEEQMIGFEIAEFDPHRDKNHMTEILIANLVALVTLGETL